MTDAKSRDEVLMVLAYAFLVIMGALCVMLLEKMWRDRIDLSTLLDEANGDASMSRFQLLIFTLLVAVGVFLFVLNNLTLPDIPNSVLVLVGISSSTYAAGKGISFSRPEGVMKPGQAPGGAAPLMVTPPAVVSGAEGPVVAEGGPE
jgi:hypothetical protein